MTATAHHPARMQEAAEYGEVAGREYQAHAEQTCPPEEWTTTAQAKWCAMLEEIRENPYEVGPRMYPDATDQMNDAYAKAWTMAFEVGRHAVQAENRRAAA